MVGKIKTNSVLIVTMPFRASESRRGRAWRGAKPQTTRCLGNGIERPPLALCPHPSSPPQTPKLKDFSKQQNLPSLSAQPQQSPGLCGGQSHQLRQPLSPRPFQSRPAAKGRNICSSQNI